MLPNPLKKLTRRADATTAKLLKALKRAQDAARLEILKATAKGGVAGDAAERERLYERIRREYQTFGREMDDAMSGLVQAAGKTATQGIADAGLDVHFSKKRLDAVWDYISPPNTRSLSAVFTDQMSENAIKQLRGAFLDTYRQAVIEGWTANETSKHMRDAWDGVAHDEDTFRFVDKSGKRWENARYLQMLHRTTAMRVERDYTLDRMADAGIQHSRVAGSGGECDICKAWEGQILTSVKTKGSRLPTYADAVAAGMFHPNCVHFIEPMDPDWGDDAEEIERQQKIPSPLEFSREAMQARRDKIELERYKAQGMTEADAKAEVTRSKLADAIRTGVFDREVSEAVSRGMDPAILAELNKTGVPRFQMAKKGEDPGWNRGKAGGVVRTSRTPTAEEINGIISGKLGENDGTDTVASKSEVDEFLREAAKIITPEQADRILRRGFSIQDADRNDVRFGSLLLKHLDNRGQKERDYRKERLHMAKELVKGSKPHPTDGGKDYERIYEGIVEGKQYIAIADDHGEIYEMVSYRRGTR